MEKLVFKFYCHESSFLEILSNLGDGQEMEFGQVRKIARPDRLNLSLQEVLDISYQLLGVAVTVGGAFQLIDWLRDKLSSVKGTTIIEVKGEKFNLSKAEELAKLQSFLDDYFSVNNETDHNQDL
jgi:hypothetical protein